jgi:hypothetical protein
LWLGVYAYENIVVANPDAAPNLFHGQPGGPQASMIAFLVARPNFVLDGSGLSRVEIWAVTDDASSTEKVVEKEPKLLGSAELHSGVDPVTQIWTLPIPEEPFFATDIFARGFDQDGDMIGEVSLPYIGASQIHDVLWGNPPTTTVSGQSTQRNFSFTLRPGQKISAGGLIVRLVRIENDSRCPQAAVCVWAGEVVARMELSLGNNEEIFDIRSTGSPYAFQNYRIAIAGVDPGRSAVPPAQSQYRITFEVQRL